MSVERLDLGGNAGSHSMALRWRREDYHVVKHDNCFSDWKVLVSGADWKEQAAGRERERGERFRSRNLPGPYVGAGVYELGVTLPAWKTGDGSSSTLKPEDIVVVYVGCADHIRQRLLRYCQAGARLESPRSPKSLNSSTLPRMEPWNRSLVRSRQGSPKRNSVEEPMMGKQKHSSSDVAGLSSRLEKQLSVDKRGSLSPIAERESDGGGRSGSGSPRGPRLFSEVFALGCSIAFRWASSKSKDDAEFVVSELTHAFDYAWNRGGDFDARSQDILQKIVLGRRGLQHGSTCNYNSRWRFLFRKEPAGVKVTTAHKPPPEPRTRWRQQRRSSSDFARSGGGLCMMLPRSRSHLAIVGGSSKSSKHSEFTKIDIPVDRCGVLLENGLVCNALPQKGRKRCHTHFDVRKPPRKKSSQVASSQDSRHGSLGSSDGTTSSVDSLRLGLGLQRMSPRPSSSCFSFLPTKKPKPQTEEQPRKRGSVSFSTWLSRSELIKAKSLEWLLAMEEIKGRGISTTDCATSPILKPVVLAPTEMEPSSEYETPVKAGKISLNLNRGMRIPPPVDVYQPKLDNGISHTNFVSRSPVRWPPSPLKQTYATSYNPPQFPRISFS